MSYYKSIVLDGRGQTISIIPFASGCTVYPATLSASAPVTQHPMPAIDILETKNKKIIYLNDGTKREISKYKDPFNPLIKHFREIRQKNKTYEEIRDDFLEDRIDILEFERRIEPILKREMENE